VYGKIVIELFTDVVPLAAQNFLMLSTGQLGATEMAKLHYQGSPVHRVVQGGWLQGGDIVLGTGAGSWAAIGKQGKVQDESFVCDFSNPLGGMVGFSTSQAHSIGSQFFITLGACEWMNGEYVGVGRVIQGFETLRRVNGCSTTNQKPDPSIIVVKSGRHIVM
jgi:cyclophilin family peptidyl-prolyl cis-trans isomerase